MMMQEILWLLASCVNLLFAQDPVRLRLAFLVAAVLSGVAWWACWRFPSLWNKRFRLKFFHYLLCTASAATCFIFVLTFFGLVNSKRVVATVISEWQRRALQNQSWAQIVPAGVARMLPVHESQIQAAVGYADQAYFDFRSTHPALARILVVEAEGIRTSVRTDVD